MTDNQHAGACHQKRRFHSAAHLSRSASCQLTTSGLSLQGRRVVSAYSGHQQDLLPQMHLQSTTVLAFTKRLPEVRGCTNRLDQLDILGTGELAADHVFAVLTPSFCILHNPVGLVEQPTWEQLEKLTCSRSSPSSGSSSGSCSRSGLGRGAASRACFRACIWHICHLSPSH